jgi:hypothetical protein
MEVSMSIFIRRKASFWVILTSYSYWFRTLEREPMASRKVTVNEIMVMICQWHQGDKSTGGQIQDEFVIDFEIRGKIQGLKSLFLLEGGPGKKGNMYRSMAPPSPANISTTPLQRFTLYV